MGKEIVLPWILVVSWSLAQLSWALQPVPTHSRFGENDRGDGGWCRLKTTTSLEPLNDNIDLMIQETRDILYRTDRSVIEIPAISGERFPIHVYGAHKEKATFTAESGWFKHLSGIHRVGSYYSNQFGGASTLSIHLKLGAAKLGFDHYTLKAGRHRASGTIEARIKSISMDAKLHIAKLQEICNVTLQELKIYRFTGLKLKVKGLKKPFDGMVSNIARIVMKHKNEIVRLIEEELSKSMKKVLAQYHF